MLLLRLSSKTKLSELAFSRSCCLRLTSTPLYEEKTDFEALKINYTKDCKTEVKTAILENDFATYSF